MNAPVLDAAVLAELSLSVGGDRGFVVELIQTFLSDSAEHLREIDEAVTAGDASALVRPAHTLKSSSATLGAIGLASRARELEMAGRSGSLEAPVAGSLPALHAAWQATASALTAWMEGEEGP